MVDDNQGRPCGTRRQFLSATVSSTILLGSAGCTDLAGDDDNIQDSDNDGVIDSEDYAPNDPDVQERSDISEVGTTGATPIGPTTTRQTSSQTSSTPLTGDSTTTPPTAESTTTTSESQIEDSVNVLRAEQENRALKRIIEYSAAEVTFEILSDADIRYRRGKMVAAVYGYPNGELKAIGSGEPVNIPQNEDSRFTVSIDEGSIPRNERLFHQTYIIPEDETYQTVQSSELVYLTPSDPFTISSSDQIQRDYPNHLPDEASTNNFERNHIEGSYELIWSGETDDQPWEINFVIHKWGYSKAYLEPRGRDYDEYVAVAQNSGVAAEMAQLAKADIEESGFTDRLSQINVIIDWIQSFPYVTDDVSRGYDEYPKFPAETLVDVSGDCEDTSILLASLLEASSFGVDMVLISPPNHMGVGIYGSNRRGTHYTYDGRDYYYIETTGTGWGIGDLPETYEGTEATIYQV